MRPWLVAGAFLAILGLAGCDYGPVDVGYRAPQASASKNAPSASASSGTSNGGNIAIAPPATH
jgi:hypothetical protein